MKHCLKVLSLGVLFFTTLVSSAAPASLRVLTQSAYLPGHPVLVRVEAFEPDGSRSRETWNSTATLSADGGVTLSTNSIPMRNGMGSALVTFTGGGDFNLTAALGALQTTRTLVSVAGQPVTRVGGTISGGSSTWSGIIAVTNDLTITNHVLTIQSNTLVLLRGTNAGTAGADIFVNANASIQSLGTEAHPVTFTCTNAFATNRWGQIRHNNSLASLYRHTFIHRAGRAPGEGHTGQAPALRPDGTTLTLESCSITDLCEPSSTAPGYGTPGKAMQANNSTLVFNDCLLQRVRMGPEIQGSSLLFTNGYIMDTRGPDDGDGIYLHDQQVGQIIKLVDSVLASGDDDGIDTLSSTVTVEGCILRDWASTVEDAKAISGFNGVVNVHRCLITDSTVGIAAKANAGTPARVNVTQTTMFGNLTNVIAAYKANAPGPIIDFRITNCVLWGGNPVHSDFDGGVNSSTNFVIRHSDVGENWTGTGNINSDPLFVNAVARNLRVQYGSPVINAGAPGSPLDADGTAADLGVFPFLSNPAPLIGWGTFWRYLDNGSNQGTNWYARTFNDSGWSNGLAELGYGDSDETTVVADNATPGYNVNDTDRYITTYFRRAFTVLNPSEFTNVQVSVLLDDAAVVYLNGQELFRTNITAGPFDYLTLANGSLEELVAVVNFSPALLLTGTNVLAIEIHQQSPASSDISLDVELVGQVGGTPTGPFNPVATITSPANGAGFDAPANIAITATATDADGTVTNVAFYQNGSLLWQTNAGPYNYTWASVPVGSYALTMIAADDTGRFGTSAPVNVNVSVPSTLTTNTVVALGATWRYLDNGTDQGTNWSQPAYNDAAWGAGPAPLGYCVSCSTYSYSTVVGYGGNASAKYITTYFRTRFVLDDPARATLMMLQLLRDDGAVVHLNGQEIFRIDMGGGTVGYLTPATSASNYGLLSSTLPTNFLAYLVAGTNVLSVEVHQANGTSSDIVMNARLDLVLNAETNARPIVNLTAPANGSTFAAPLSTTITANATDPDGTVTNVAFFVNGVKLLDDPSAPYSAAWNGVPAGLYSLTAVAADNFGRLATSSVFSITVSTNTAAPVVFAKSPAPGSITNLTSLNVTFSKPVLGVGAGDLLINGVPASGISGSGSNYTFTFVQPAYGAVAITWATGHGITDVFTPPAAFNTNSAGANWNYTLLDIIPPTITTISPVPGSTVAGLTSIDVTFSEPVSGVNNSDLLINGAPAGGLSGSGAGPYAFTFPQPPQGVVNVAWAGGHGIVDASANPFAPAPWSYTLDTNVSGVIISEIMYHPSSENVLEEYIELFNKGAGAVNLNGWQFSAGINYTFTNASIPANGYLVVAANLAAFQAKYPGVTNVVAGWTGVLNNDSEDIDLDDASGNRVDSVTYADEGDWAVRQRGFNDQGFRGWTWLKAHDGGGSSLELINANLSNNSGQNWGASTNLEGTPGAPNSIALNNIAPLILGTVHFPAVPRSTDPVLITARIVDEAAGGLTVNLRWRVSSASPPAFSTLTMRDDGLLGDASANDGLYSAQIAAQANGAVIEYYVQAMDAQANERTWPGPAVGSPDGGAGPTGQVVNALYQVDNEIYTGSAPLYKMVLTVAEDTELGNLMASASSFTSSDAAMNITFISVDGSGTEVRQLCSVRNRGHGSRIGNPHNYRVGFRSDEPWKGISALNLNARTVHAQHFGSILALKSGAVGGDSRAVQLRINGDSGLAGVPTFNHYAANEDIGGTWARNHFPEDGGGNAYKVVRDLPPSPYPNFDYRFGNVAQYQRTYVKQSNVSENDWTDLDAMLEVMGENRTNLWTLERARGVINVDQWLRHLAVMTLLGNNESGLNTGNNDDYFMYRGEIDPRFLLLYHDLDQILGESSQATTESIFRSTQPPISGDTEGTWRTMGWFLSDTYVRAEYYRTLQNLLDTTFSQPEFDALIDHTLSSYVPAGNITSMKSWMNARRAYVQGVITGLVPPATNSPVATISGEPRSPSPSRSATLTVGGTDIVNYRWRLNGGAWSASVAVGVPISLVNLSQGVTNVVYVVGQNSGGIFQSTNTPTVSQAWVVRTNTPTVRLNEVLASNNGALIHVATTPDAIELFNDGTASVNLGGLRLTDDKDVPGKYTFPSTVLAAGAYLTVFANNDDGTGGLHTGFTLDPDGDQVYLFDRATNGNVILDSVKFGAQITDLSIGRTGAGGTWALTTPTFGTANTAATLGNQNNLKINEWLALSATVSDFVELYNPNGQPVALGGLYLTDEIIGVPNLSRIDDLSFLGANSYLAFTADGDGSIPTHANFQLPSEQGMIGLFSATLQTIDSVAYGPQQPDVSQGKCPNGGATYATMSVPTPGAPNACPIIPPAPVSVSLLTISNVWSYQPRTNYDAVNWTTNTYNDSSWPTGLALLGRQSFASNQTWPEPFRTHIETNLTQTNFYFRGHFTVAPGTTFSSLQFRHIIDDGAVFFLNGVEIPGSRFNMPGGAVNGTTFAASTVSLGSYQGPFTIPVSMLLTGDNVFAVSVHQAANNSSDVAMGVELTGLIVTNSPALAGVLINEVLANNLSLSEPDGSNPDWVELYNPSTNAVDLGDMSLTDDTTVPRRWVIPGGTILAAQAYVKFRFDSGLPASATNTGFALKANGGGVYLFNRLADGGSVLSSVAYGLQAADYSIGRVPNGSSNWVLTIPTLGSANIAASLGSAFALRLNEWMANPSSGQDYFEVFNPNPQPVDISRFYLTDNLSQRTKHQLPALSFIGIGEDAYQKFDADSNPLAGADHVNFSLAAGGEALGLTHSNLTAIDSVSFGPQSAGVSQGRLPDGAAGIVNFPLTPTPGNGNFLPLTSVVINELIAHTDLPLEDAVEVHNPTGDDVDISGWYLSDSQDNLFKYRIPSNTVVTAGGYQVIYEVDFNGGAGVPFSFSSAKGDEVYLSQSLSPGTATGYRAFAKFGASANGVSFGRFATSLGVDFTAMSARTFGQDSPATVAQFRTGGGLTNAYPKVGPLVINEVMYNFGGGTNNDVLEFLELRNVTGAPLPLYDVANPQNTWRIREGIDFNFPSNTVVPAGGYLVLVNFDPVNDSASRATFTNTYGNAMTLMGPYSGRLNNDGEDLEIQRPDAPQTVPGPDFGLVPYLVVDRVDYKDVFPWAPVADGSGWSLSKLTSTLYGNEAFNWQGNPPTPGAANFAAPTNTPPTINTLANRSVHAGYPLSFTATANDPDVPGQTLTWSLVNTVPSGATIGSGSGVFNWTPTTNQIAAHTISVRVTDNGSPNLSDTKNFTLTVLPLPRVSSVTVSNGVSYLAWPSHAGRRYQIFTTPTLSPANWVQLGGDIIASGATTAVPVGSGNDPTRFYQILSFDN